MLHFGIIGYPLRQSFSAEYFNKKFAEEHIDFNWEIMVDIYRHECSFPTFEPIAEIPIFNLEDPETFPSLLDVIEILCSNWSLFVKLYEKMDLCDYFFYILNLGNIKQKQDVLINKARLVDGEVLLRNAKSYAFLLHYSGEKRISKSKLHKFLQAELLNGSCGAYWVNHSIELKKLKERKEDIPEIFETLFYYACIHEKGT